MVEHALGRLNVTFHKPFFDKRWIGGSKVYIKLKIPIILQGRGCGAGVSEQHLPQTILVEQASATEMHPI